MAAPAKVSLGFVPIKVPSPDMLNVTLYPCWAVTINSMMEYPHVAVSLTVPYILTYLAFTAGEIGHTSVPPSPMVVEYWSVQLAASSDVWTWYDVAAASQSSVTGPGKREQTSRFPDHMGLTCIHAAQFTRHLD